MGVKKVIKQTPKVYDVCDRRGNFLYQVHSRNREDCTLTKKYIRVDDLLELEENELYYIKGLDGKICMSFVYDLTGPEVHFQKVLRSQIRSKMIYKIEVPKKKEKLKLKQLF